ALFVVFLAIGSLRGAVAPWRNDWLGAAFLNVGDKRVAVVGLVGNDLLGLAVGDQCRSLGNIMILSRREDDGDRLSQAIAGHVQLGAEATARTPQGLVLGRAAFGARRVLVGADDGGIQQQHTEIRILQVLQDGAKHPGLTPAIEALKNAVPIAKPFGQITPRGTGLGNPQNGIHKQAIILGRHARVAFLAGQQVLDGLPLLIRDFMASQHERFASEGKPLDHHRSDRVPIAGRSKPRPSRRHATANGKLSETAESSTITRTAKATPVAGYTPPLRYLSSLIVNTP